MQKAPIADKETVLAAIRDAVKAAGGKQIRLEAFLGSSGIKRRDIFHHFDRWHEAMQAAGFDFQPRNQRIDDVDLFGDWARVVRKLGRLPSKSRYDRHGKYSSSVILRRAGTWAHIPQAFRIFAARRARWKDILAFIPLAPPSRPDGEPRKPAAFPVSPRRSARKFAVLPNGRPLRGNLLGAGGMLYAPLNETGVVYLFGMLAADLGFQVEALQAGYPDCEARRLVAKDAWQTVRIEFEYESRNFREHGHNPQSCDIIVCWLHNWPDCPKNLEVIELSKEVKRIGSDKTAQ